jgi:hypothetical protein
LLFSLVKRREKVEETDPTAGKLTPIDAAAHPTTGPVPFAELISFPSSADEAE